MPDLCLSPNYKFEICLKTGLKTDDWNIKKIKKSYSRPILPLPKVLIVSSKNETFALINGMITY